MINLSSLTLADHVIRAGIQGFPGTGKTFAALTFPGVRVLDFDKKLQGHYGRNIEVEPFSDYEFYETYANGRFKKGSLLNKAKYSQPLRTEALEHYLETDAALMDKGSTLFLDSWSAVEVAWDDFRWEHPPITKTGEVDNWQIYREKGQFAARVFARLKSLKCNVVVSFHEQILRDKDGNPTSKLHPLMEGKFKDQLGRHFTDWFRQTARDEEETKKANDGLGRWRWQITADKFVDCSTLIKNPPKYINASYDAYMEAWNKNNLIP